MTSRALLLSLLVAAPLGAQAVPSTDIWLVPLSSGRTVPAKAVDATPRAGYDNQPHFLPDGSGFLYTSVREGEQADIWRYDLRSGTSTRVTASSPESEYSATPLGDGSWFSSVRVERDSTQRLWRFPVSGSGEPSVILADVKPVGYHAWITDSLLAMFVLGTPSTLQVAKLGQGGAAVYAHDIGRGLAAVPGHRAVVYVAHDPAGPKLVELSFDEPGQFRTRTLIKTLPGQEFFTFAPDGTLLSASGDGVLYRWNGECADKARWVESGRLGHTGVTRLAVSPDGKWLAFVAPEGK